MNQSGAQAIRFLAYFAGVLAAALALWVDRMFGTPSIDQILYHLYYAEGAAVEMSEVFVATFLVEVLAASLVVAAIAATLHARLARGFGGWKAWAMRALPHLAVLGGLAALLLQFSVFSYAAAHFEPDHFARNYVDPRDVALRPGKPRNLVLIYAESLEQTYGNTDLFGRDLLAPLRRLGGHSYPSYRQAPGATWTIAGLVATQCGVPLKVYAEHDVDRAGGGKVFLPGATCLGDLLQAHGYRNVFMGGAPLSFAGKGAFLHDHGYAESWGRDEWLRQGPIAIRDRNAWGLYDSKLFEHARQRLAELHAAGQPFNLTLLTLDTHNPGGLLSPDCREQGINEFKGIVSCSAERIAGFVEFARERGYLEDTVVVIVGDHLAVPNSLWDQLQQAGESRRIYNLVLAAGGPTPNTGELLHYDMFPTLLDLVGLDVAGDRLGLGYSAVGPIEVPRPADRVELLARTAWERASAGYDRLWEPPQERGTH